MAANVMNRLEMQKLSREQAPQTGMSKALAAFVEGKSNIPIDWKIDNLLAQELDTQTTSSSGSVDASSNTVKDFE